MLIPDGSGYYFPKAYEPLNLIAITSANRAKFQRTIRYALLRTWMFNRIPLIPVPLGRTTATSAKYGNPEDNFTPEAWAQEQGRWVQPPETLDLRFTWTPRRNTFLESQGEFASLAFWMAMELSDPEVIQEDIALLEYLDSNEARQLGGGSQHALLSGRLWPYLLESGEARMLVRSLHAWCEKVGGQQAIQWVIQVFRQAQPGSLEAMLPALQQLSGVPVLEEKR